jgi:hypothetical protein
VAVDIRSKVLRVAIVAAVSLVAARAEEKNGRVTDPARAPLTAVDGSSFTSYKIRPGATTPGLTCSTGRIGCNGAGAGEWGPYAPNDDHVLYLPHSVNPRYRNNLLVFFNGLNGSPDKTNDRIYKVASDQGYYVIGLNYFSAGYVKDRHEDEPPGMGTACAVDPDTQLACLGAYMNEVVTGKDCGSMCGPLNMEKHPQDAVEMRLLRVLQWAIYNHANDGWERFLTRGGLKGGGDRINWNLITIAGFSNGSSYAAFMGQKYATVARVALLNGPNDGKTRSRVWKAADYLKNVPGLTDTRYYGLVHYRNHEDKLFELIGTYDALGMKGRILFEPRPHPDKAIDFGTNHMLISIDSKTPPDEGHTSVVNDEYKDCTPGSDPDACTIGYEEAWRYIFGSGRQLYVPSRPQFGRPFLH